MKLIKSDNRQCVLAAFAMLMDTTMDELKERLGHDGKDVVLENQPEPFCFRSFHPQEFIDLLYEDGYSCSMIELNPMLNHGNQFLNHASFIGQTRFFEWLLRGDGVLFGEVGGIGHAVAWNSNNFTIYDPRGYKYRWNSGQDFKPRQFFIVQRIGTGNV